MKKGNFQLLDKNQGKFLKTLESIFCS